MNNDRKPAMRCLLCWNTLLSDTALYTKSCEHVFCKPCGENAFQNELACPYCDKVLPKDGVEEFKPRPNSAQLRTVAATLRGLNPSGLCSVIQQGMEFWDSHHQNEKHLLEEKVRAAEKDRNLAVAATKNTAALLEQERQRSNSLRDEIETLKSNLADVEAKYAAKARSARKVAELYEDLRKVYRRLESDLLEANHAVESQGKCRTPSEHLQDDNLQRKATLLPAKQRTASSQSRPSQIVTQDLDSKYPKRLSGNRLQDAAWERRQHRFHDIQGPSYRDKLQKKSTVEQRMEQASYREESTVFQPRPDRSSQEHLATARHRALDHNARVFNMGGRREPPSEQENHTSYSSR